MLGECICQTDYDAAEFFRDRMVRGRKAYTCCECRRVVPKGVRHEYAEGVFEDEWFHYRTCELCVSIRNSLFRCGYGFGSLWGDIRDHLGGTDDDSWLDPPTHPIRGPNA